MDSRSEFISEISTFEKNVILVYLGYKPSGERLLVSSLNTDESYDFNQYPLLKLSRIVTINVNKAMKYNELIKFILGDIYHFKIQSSLSRNGEDLEEGIGLICKGSALWKQDILPLNQVQEDAEMYDDKYLGGFGQYLSVSARFEMVTRAYSGMPNTQRRKKIDDAINRIMISVAKNKVAKQIATVHLSYDYGNFGSGTFKRNKYYNSSDLLVKFQQDLYNNEMTYDD